MTPSLIVLRVDDSRGPDAKVTPQARTHAGDVIHVLPAEVELTPLVLGNADYRFLRTVLLPVEANAFQAPHVNPVTGVAISMRAWRLDVSALGDLPPHVVVDVPRSVVIAAASRK